MATDPRKPPSNRDQEQPPPTGETIESTATEREPGKPERNAPLSEEETYERERDDQRSDEGVE
jgi:hypothetical protein